MVTLNARKLADTLGEEVADVETAIEFLCRPDERSTTKEDEGRRLVKLGEFECLVEPPFPQTSAVQGKGDNQIGAAVGRRLSQNASEERSE